MSGYVQVEDITNADQLRASLSRLYARRAKERKPAPRLRLVEPTNPEPTSIERKPIKRNPFPPHLLPLIREPYELISAQRAAGWEFSPTGKITIQIVINRVCKTYGHSQNELVSSRREQPIVRHRQIAIYLCRELTPCSLPAIGRLFGGRDHTTVLHSCRVIQGLIQANPKLGKEIEAIEQQIRHGEG